MFVTRSHRAGSPCGVQPIGHGGLKAMIPFALSNERADFITGLIKNHVNERNGGAL